jgi:protein disulfide-isomerase A1
MKTSTYFLFALLGFINSALAFPTEEGVLVLDDDNFDDAIAQHEFILVEFYAPWCGHCKQLAPEYAAAAQKLSGETAKLAKLDATEAKDAAQRFDIKGFPTLLFFKNGKKMEYNAGRTANDIVNWVKKHSGPPAKTLSSTDDVLALQESGDAVVVGYFADAESANAKAFLALAGSDDNLEYGISSDDSVKEHLTLSADTIVVLKPFDNKRADFVVGDSFDASAAGAFITEESTPLVQTFSQAGARKIFSSPIQKHALFFTDKMKPHHGEVKDVFTGVAKNFKGTALVVNVPSSEAKVTEYFGVTEFPSFVFVDMSSGSSLKKYPFDGDLKDAAAISAHMNAVLSGELKASLKSEEVSPEDTAGNVKVLKGKSFNDIVMNNDKDVLVEFYAPWCGHCKKLAPTYDELGDKFASVDSVVIAKMDATANEIDVDGVDVKGFPTLYFFPGNDKKNPVRYESGRELEDFVEYLKDNVSNKFDHEEL